MGIKMVRQDMYSLRELESIFERENVSDVIPNVMILPDKLYMLILTSDEFGEEIDETEYEKEPGASQGSKNANTG